MTPLDPVFAGIDLSTTTARCVIVDASLRVRGVARFAHTDMGAGLRQSARAWVDSVESAIRGAVSQVGIRPDQIVGVGIATQGVASVMVDENGNEIGETRGWLSASGGSGSALHTDVLDSWYRRSGRRISAESLAGRLLVGDATPARWSLAGDLIAHELSGEWAIDRCLAATTGLLDQCSGDWSDELLDEVGASRRSLSRVVPSGVAIGRAVGSMAQRLGLSPEATVASPTQDQRAAVLVADPDETALTVTFGTAVAIVRRADGCHSRSAEQVPLTPGLVPASWWHEGVVPAVGATFDWCAGLMGLPDTAAWLDLAAEVEVGASTSVCEPWFGGRGSAAWDSAATGALVGLELGSTRADVARAVVDGVCREIADNAELLEPADEVRIVGRAAAHPTVVGTLAVVLGRPVTRVCADEPTAFGAALLGATGAGHVESAHAAARQALRTETVDPNGGLR